MKVIFPQIFVGTAIQYPDAIGFFANTVIINGNIIADYSGTESLTAYTGFMPTDYKPLTPYAFLQRLTVAERVAARSLSGTDMVVADFMSMLDHAGMSNMPIMLNDPETIAGVDYIGTVPSTAPILTAARIAQILNPTL